MFTVRTETSTLDVKIKLARGHALFISARVVTDIRQKNCGCFVLPNQAK